MSTNTEWTEERRYWLNKQLECDYMRGPWVVVEKFDALYEPDSIAVIWQGPLSTVIIAEWKMNGVRRWSPAYYMMRAHAEVLANAPKNATAQSPLQQAAD